MIPTITIVALVTIYLIGTIIFYIEQKPVANQSSFDIVALHLAWTTLHIGRFDTFEFFSTNPMVHYILSTYNALAVLMFGLTYNSYIEKWP